MRISDWSSDVCSSDLYENGPELRVAEWLSPDGNELDAPVELSDLGAGTEILFASQHWCPGCHSRGVLIARPARRVTSRPAGPHPIICRARRSCMRRPADARRAAAHCAGWART